MSDEQSRRSFLRSAGGTLGASWLTLKWPQIAHAAQHSHQAAQAPAAPTPRFFTTEEAADVAAIAAQIIPSDETPGAREAGVVFFIDQALATFFARRATRFRNDLAGFRAQYAAQFPNRGPFAALPDKEQIQYLRRVEHTPFFDSMRTLTVLGMFASPAYGGNRELAGWTLLGFEDQHVFEPPFGHYDRDYPGFFIEPKK
jgi:gluconate 2-dehydrogenase gamma chain